MIDDELRCVCTNSDESVRCSGEATNDDGLCDMCRNAGGKHRVSD